MGWLKWSGDRCLGETWGGVGVWEAYLPVLVELEEPPHIVPASGGWASLLQGLLQEPALLQAVDMRGSNPHGTGWGWGWRRWDRSLETTGRGWQSHVQGTWG